MENFMNPILFPIILNPFIISTCAVGCFAWLLLRPGMRSYRLRLIVGVGMALVAYFGLDFSFAKRRVEYAEQLPKRLIVHRTVPLPTSLNFVNVPCDQTCLSRLVDGTLTNVVSIFDGPTSSESTETPRSRRYRITRAEPNNCPADLDRRAEKWWTTTTVKALWTRGICPTIDEVETPSQGLFLVRAAQQVMPSQHARQFSSKYLVSKPPGVAIAFFAFEVQQRIGDKVEVLAETQYYEAPGYLALPPLIGCWARPDNIVWIMPPGDAGCGFWRHIVAGGDQRYARSGSGEWAYEMAFQDPK